MTQGPKREARKLQTDLQWLRTHLWELQKRKDALLTDAEKAGRELTAVARRVAAIDEKLRELLGEEQPATRGR